MISLCYSNGKAYIWNADDWFTLRSEHRIVGKLIGRLPSCPNQEECFGLPMVLMSEEACLLIEKNICELHELLDLKRGPTEEQLKEAEVLLKKQMKEQVVELKRLKVEKFIEYTDTAIAGKRRKLVAQGVPEEDITLDKETFVQEETERITQTDIPLKHTLIHVPTEYPWDSEKRKLGIEYLKPSVLDDDGRLRYAVFKDLWEKGLHLTDGLKFGADFLVYSEGPEKVHAMYMVRCVDSNEALMRPSTLVAFGRLSVSVNKLAVLAYFDKNGLVAYQTLQWHDSVNG